MHIPVAGNGNKQLVPDIPYSSVWYVMISFEQATHFAPKQQFSAADTVIPNSLSLSLSLSVWVGLLSYWYWSEWVCSQSTAIILFILRYAAGSSFSFFFSSHIGTHKVTHKDREQRDES